MIQRHTLRHEKQCRTKNQNILFYRTPELLKQLTKRKYGIYRRFPKIWLSKTTAST